MDVRLHSLAWFLPGSGNVVQEAEGVGTVLAWSVLALVLGALLMLLFNVLQDPPWFHDDDPPEPRPEA